MNIEALAREADAAHDNVTITPFLERFAARIREAVVQELVAGSGEPAAYMYPDDHKRMTLTDTFCPVYSVPCVSPIRGSTSVHLYTTDQLSGAVLRERERIADEWHLCVSSDLENGVKFMNEQAWEKWRKEYPAISGFAAAIRSGE